MAGENSLQFLGLNFEDILPWGVVGGDTGLSARLKLKRNFDKIQTRFNADQALYLSKINDDTAQGLIRLIRGLQVGERFVTGLLGEGGIFRKEADGTTYIEADKLYIRMKAYFDSVEMREYRHSVGNRIASEAGAKCCRVDWIDASGNSLKQTSENLASTVLFRCYFRGSDGEDEVRNNFIVGDLAYCHITTVETEDDSPIAKGLNMTHYWRLIVGRNAHGTLTDDGEHWIDLSNRVSETVTISGTSYTRKGYQPGSDVPAAQNDIIQLGNIRDTDRQGAIIEFVTGADAPSYQIFQGIGSDVSNPYSLEGKNYVRFGYDSESGGAQAFIGNPDGSTYLWYHNVTEGGVTHPKLEIKAEVSLSSTFGGKSFEELVVEYAPEGWTEEEITQLIVDETDPMFSDIETALDTIQRQVDGSISTWFYGGAPTLSNQPASQWDTADLKNEHLGDLYYDNLTGYGYRFKYDETSRQWSWGRITDVDVTKALADAAKAQDTADHKRRVFVVQPTPPYDQGDLWVNATYPSGNTETNAAQNKYYNDVLRCKTAKASGTTFAIADWELASKYTDDTAFNNFFANTYQPFVTQIQSQVDGKAETWYQATDPSAAWNTSALKQAHVGDIWHNTSSATVSGVEAGQDAIWSGSEWKPSTVPQEVYDKIDGKADIFVSKPSTYNANDMWIIESGLASSDMPSGCVVGDIVISSAARKNSYTKSDWKKKDRYTDDSSLIAFIGGYTGTAQELQNQIDKKAETWYQATNPASVSGWVAEDHVGDLWYCTADISGTSYKAGTTWYYMDNGASASPRYAWVQQDIPDAVFDMIDGKAQIFVSQPSNYHAKDLWILAADSTVNGVACKQGEVLVSSADSATYNQAHWSRKLRYTDDSALNTFLNGYAGTLTGIINSITNAQNTANAAQQSADDANALAATANYLKQAFLDNTGQAQTTDITGGLVLSTIVALRDANKKVWSGISGAYQAQETGTGYKGHGIAAWYGGGMVDGEVSTSSSNAAKSLFRFDGSGYVANKNISWDKNGNVTIQGYSINATTLKSNGSAVATESMLANYVTIATAQTITGAKTFGTADGSYIQIGAVRIVYDATNNALKIVGSNGSSAANLYATGSVSALGAGSGSSGGGDVTWALLASSSDTRQIALSHLTGALSSYATQSWVNSQIAGMSTSLAGLSDVNVSGVTSGQYLKFNGQGWVPDTPSSGGGDVTWDSLASNSDTRSIALSHLTTALSGYATQLWVQQQGFLTSIAAATASALGGIKVGYTTSGKNYKVQLDSSNNAYVNVPWENTTYPSGTAELLTAGTDTTDRVWSAKILSENVGGRQYYGTCSTAAATQTKVATIPASQNFRLAVGAIITIKFSNTNTFSATGTDLITLNVNGTGAKQIWYNTSAANTGTNTACYGYKNRYTTYIYDGTYWVWVSRGMDTSYSVGTAALLTEGSNTTNRVWSAKILKDKFDKYLPLTGGTMTGTLGVTGATTLSSTLSVSGLLTASGGITIPDGKTLKIGDAVLSWDSTNQGIKITKGLYSQTFISALGTGDGGSSGTRDVTWALLASSSDTRQIALSHLTNALSSYATQSWVNSQIAGMSTSLAGLSDVDVSGVTSGQYLKFNGQKWVADTPSSGTTSTRNLVIGGASYTVTSPYKTNVDVDSVYLKLSGGSLSGGLAIAASNYASQLTIKRSDSANDAVIRYENSSGFIGLMGVSSTSYPYFTSSPDGSNVQRIWTSGNDGNGSGLDADLLDGQHGSYYATASSLGNYLPLSGGSLSGVLTMGSMQQVQWIDRNCMIYGNGDSIINVVASGFLYNNNNVWHEGNDGSGSGLDADLLDGQHGSYYATASSLGNYLPLSGGTMTGEINVNGYTSFGVVGNNFYVGNPNYPVIFRGNGINIESTTSLSGHLYLTGAQPYSSTGNTSQIVFGTSSNNHVVITSNNNAIVINPSTSDTKNQILLSVNGYGSSYISSGTVGIGTTSPSYKLHVNGTFCASGNSSIGGTFGVSGAATLSSTLGVTGATTLSSTLAVTGNAKFSGYTGFGYDADSSYRVKVNGVVYASTGVYSAGYVTALSDIREKMIVRPTEITVEQIAKMPSIVYRWKNNGDDHDEHVGSIAQDWQKTLPQVVLTAKDEKKTLSMQYGVAALVSAITIARKVVDHERRIKELENENRKLKEQLKIA